MRPLRILILLSLLASFQANAQSYPVQSFVQVSPPFTSYLPEYGDPFNNQMKVLLTLADFTVPSYNVKIRLSFEGSGWSATTGDLVPLPLFSLSPGVPLEISGSSLAPYLSTSNLIFSGIDVVDYESRKVLPEGPCTVCAEVIDYSGSNQSALSMKSCTQVWFSLNDPPLLNTPFCGTEVIPTTPQNVFFSWTPLSISNPSGSLGTDYTFELFEIRPDGADPNQVVNASLPIYIETTTNTFVNYSIMQPPLQLGMSYVWRVKARDVSGKDAFRNNGYSAVCVFTYGSVAGALLEGLTLELDAQGTGVRQGLAWWNGSSIFSEYRLEVRKTGDPTLSWFPQTVTDFTKKINSLEPETEYEARVKGILGEEETEWSNTVVFTTQPPPNYECESTAFPPTQTGIVPLDFANVGMTFTVGQFDLDVTSINELPSPGHYSGFGKIHIPFGFINMKVKFDDILVDENLFVRSGAVVALTKGMDGWIDEHTNIPFSVPGVIDGHKFNGDSSVTVYFNDQEVTYDFPPSGTIEVEDESGLIYRFNSDGTYSISGNITESEDQLDATKDHQVIFKAHENQRYGFDENLYLQWQADYEAILLADSTYYFVPYKSIGEESDLVKAEIKTTSSMGALTFFSTGGGTVNAEKKSDSEYDLTLTGFTASCYIYALEGDQKVGKLFVKQYKKLQKELVLVPVNGASISDPSAALNKIYGQANVNWDVVIDDAFSSTVWDVNEDGKMQLADGNLMQKYSAEMKGLRDEYFKTHEKEEKYYLFVVPAFSDSKTDGYMVRGRAVGFVQSGASYKTVAHELAHGAFDLGHTFPTIEQGFTDNLMDYSDGEHLAERQWYEIRNNNPVISFFDDDEDAAYVNESIDEILDFYDDIQVYTNVTDEYAYPLLDGTFLKIPSVNNIVFTKYGKVYKFTIAETEYRPVFGRGVVSGDYSYYGYFSQDDWDYLLHEFPEDGDKQTEFDARRFTGWGSVETGDSIFTRSVKYRAGDFEDCYCTQKWSTASTVNHVDYLGSSSQYQNSIDYRIDYGEDISFSRCVGPCPDYDAYDIKGPAENLFIALYDDVLEGDREELATMIHHINQVADGKTFVFYAELDDKYSNGQEYWYSYDLDFIDSKSSTIQFFKDFEIYSKTKFDSFFPVVSEGDKNYDIVFSPVDLWGFKSASPYYNAHTIDFNSFPIPHVKNWHPSDPEPVLEVIDFIEELYNHQVSTYPELAAEDNFKDIVEFVASVREDPTFWLEYKLQLRMNIIPCFNFLGMFKLYEYDLQDLIARRVVVNLGNDNFVSAITNAEQAGAAIPLYIGNEYSQYIGKYDTDCAFYLGFEYMKMYVETLFEPAVLATLIARSQKVVSSYKSFKGNKNVDDIFKGSGKVDESAGTLDDLFGNARKNAITKYGDEAEYLIYVKFKDDGGAAAVIMNRFGDEGLQALQKFDDLDDVANELIKEKVLYRYIGSEVTYLSSLKLNGKLPEGYETYLTLDRYTDPVEAASKMQLPPENDALWRLEFGSQQVENAIFFPIGKWNNANYKEVLTRSFPEWGEGGATQFISKNEINLDKMINLKTGEVVNF